MLIGSPPRRNFRIRPGTNVLKSRSNIVILLAGFGCGSRLKLDLVISANASDPATASDKRR
jgi:hypothetical protein